MNFQEQSILKLAEDKKNVFIYVSREDEPDTRQAIKKLLLKKHNVIVPKIRADNLSPIHIKSISELKIGTYGILEPETDEVFDKNLIDIFFVPGTSFDGFGNRKGRGRGYFDRFLEGVDEVTVVGLCREEQVVPQLDVQDHDVPVDMILTEKRLIRT